MTVPVNQREYMDVHISVGATILEYRGPRMRRAELKRHLQCLKAMSDNGLVMPDKMVLADLYLPESKKMQAGDL
jgi:hypothetical protein